MLASTAVSKAIQALISREQAKLAFFGKSKNLVQIGVKSKIYYEGPKSSLMLTNKNSLNNNQLFLIKYVESALFYLKYCL